MYQDGRDNLALLIFLASHWCDSLSAMPQLSTELKAQRKTMIIPQDRISNWVSNCASMAMSSNSFNSSSSKSSSSSSLPLFLPGSLPPILVSLLGANMFPNVFGMSLVGQVASFRRMPPMSSEHLQFLMSEFGNILSQQ